MSKFAIFTNKNQQSVALKFPEFLWISRNYYHLQWTAKKQQRRLKNVIVMVDWLPSEDPVGLTLSTIGQMLKKPDTFVRPPPMTAFTGDQEALLVRSFELFDVDEDGYLTREDLMQLAAVMALRDPDSISKVLSYLKTSDNPAGEPAGKVSFSGFREIIREQVESLRYLTHEASDGSQVVSGGKSRFCAVLCLSEGEHLRRALHLMSTKMRTASGTKAAIMSSPSSIVAGLWTLGSGEMSSTSDIYDKDWSRLLLGSSQGFQVSSYAQYSAMRNCYRFLNNDLDLVDEDITMLLRVLANSSCKDRLSWWMDVRACRRRRQTVWDGSALSVGVVFGTKDEYCYMEHKALILRVKSALRECGMLVFDAFRAMNSSRSGALSCSELYGGMEWLGIRLEPSQVYDLVRRLSIEIEGMVSYHDFRRAFQNSDEDMESHTVADDSKSNFEMILPKYIPELTAQMAMQQVYESVEVTAEMLKYVKVKAKLMTGVTAIWNSQGSLSQTQMCIWAPDLQISMIHSNNRARVCLGHYATEGLSNPMVSGRSLGLATVEVTDTAALRLIQRSTALKAVLDKVFPHPLRFKGVWHLSRGGGQPLFAWRATAPDSYLALGMVCTTSEEPPDVSCIRCVPAHWCIPAKNAPRKVWDDSGAGGGRPGSVWAVNSLQLIAVSVGHDIPKEVFYDLDHDRFFIDDAMIAAIASGSSNSGHGVGASSSKSSVGGSLKK